MTAAPLPVAHDLTAGHALWAPAAQRVEIRRDGRIEPMRRREDGWHTLASSPVRAGERYAFRLDGDGPWIPDPRSLSQVDGVHADSEVVDLAALADLAAGDGTWTGRDLRGRVLYELHVGTFTPGPGGRGGTLDSAIERLDDLVELGVDAIEVMPVATFPGDRGWGYDGVGLYAVHAAYGGPAALARFVAAAHERGLAVLLDVVFNHLGPAGNYLGLLGPYFTDHHHTPWGEAVNLDRPGSEEVRGFLLRAARQWLVDLGLDGLRLDAVHELHDDSPTPFLAELSLAAAGWEQETGRPLALIAESDRNDPRTVTPVAAGGLGMDMQWADDVHHGVHAWITGEREGYYGDFGSAEVLATVLTRMFLHAGTYSSFRGRVWGATVDPASRDYDAHSFVTFLQDHDQVGNRAAGDRIHHDLDPRRHAAAAALILLGPGTPMLFQGEEWAASTPFAYVTDHEEELGRLVTAGRTREFARRGWSQTVPDPQARSTFTASMLRWDEREEEDHARMLAWYRTLLTLRKELPALRDPDLRRTEVQVLGEEMVVLRRGDVAVLAHRGEGEAAAPGGGRQVASFGEVTPEGALRGPGVLVLDAADR